MEYQLRGCCNDSRLLQRALTELYGFTDIQMMLDDDARTVKPTAENIIAAISALSRRAAAGDAVVIAFSGHGTQIPDTSGTEKDGMDEALMAHPAVGNQFRAEDLVLDNVLHSLIEQFPSDCNLTAIFDCCHSGTMLDHNTIIIEGSKDGKVYAPRQPSQLSTMFVPRGVHWSKIDFGGYFGGIRMQAAQMFHGAREGLSGLKSRLKSLVGRQQQDHGLRDLKAEGVQVSPDKGILITGCQDNEEAGDYLCPENQEYQGVMTYMLVKTLRANPDVTYRELVTRIRSQLSEANYPQNPCLSCADSNADRQFLR
eukprot:TRINITY_DN2154_c0_g1_i4.p1 TRINITY_DN2154_c0_g1~~TRINITY_DN2154_c0_g1_i4.p1  ORF type:complete len:312 (+),score=58.01 TRINITY_DN2154_c0_g1_i4:719-1654(+)